MSEDKWPIDQAAIRDAVTWLITARRFAGPRKVLDELCSRLTAAGVGVFRSSAFIRTLHPSILGRRYTWTAGEGIDMVEAPYAVLDSDLFRMSPVAKVYTTAEPLRLRVGEVGFQSHYNNIDELRDEGASDYVIQPLFFTNGEVHAISWTTRRAGGFSDDELAAFDAVVPPFTRATEIYCLRRTAVTLLDTYVGHGAGARILSGNINRGDAQEIDAVILAADLRGFTDYTASHDGAQVVERLNAFFDILVAPITARGGEVLKFTGDGLLAMFPYERAADRGQRCRDALDAAQTAVEALAGSTGADEAIRCGIALHPGRVLFGNVGSDSRLDFTAIGAAVNLAARLETLAGELGRDIVVSADFAAGEGGKYQSLGHFKLKGLADDREAFVPAGGS